MACSADAPEISDNGQEGARGTNGQKLQAIAATAPDPTEVGPEAVTSAEYQFPAEVDADVLSDRKTELWARVYRPENLGQGTHPVLVFLHGNHATCGQGTNPRVDDNCQYTTTGTCASDHVVTPNHLGYAYIAERLASHGYVVVSVNANRGITCGSGAPSSDPFLNLSRGRLVLKHLQRLSEWNANGGTPASLGVELQGKLDFSQVGLMGHSRGGEGIRAAYNFYREPNSTWPTKILSPVSFRGLFEIGPVDGQLPNGAAKLNADGTTWSVLLPMCDGDVSTLAGIRPYDRMVRNRTDTPATQKSTFTVWGANHNFYNTEWQQTDARGVACTGHTKLWENDLSVGSEKQRTTGLVSVIGFFRANVGPNADAKYNQIFNPMFELPTAVTEITRVDRGYTDSPSSSITNVIEDFEQATDTNTHGTANDRAGITINHDKVPTHWDGDTNTVPVQKAGLISWQSASTETFFQTNWTVAGEGQDISSYKTLDIRISRQNNTLNPVADSDFSIQLALADGSLSSAVSLIAYASVRGPVGGPNNNIHPILQSARIPLTDFGSVDLTKVRGVRFVFDKTTSGAIYLGNVRLSNVITLPATVAPALASTNPSASNNTNGAAPVKEIHTKGNAIKDIRRAAPQAAAANAAVATRDIEIELETAENFPIRDAFPVLRIGERDFEISGHPNGDTRRIIFTVPEADFASAKNGEKVTVYYSEYETSAQWAFGKLDKRALK